MVMRIVMRMVKIITFGIKTQSSLHFIQLYIFTSKADRAYCNGFPAINRDGDLVEGSEERIGFVLFLIPARSGVDERGDLDLKIKIHLVLK